MQAKPTPSATPVIAYFSMEVALESAMRTYAGGLGVLAGDTLRAAADLGLPLVGVTLIHRGGYFHQVLDERGQQREEPAGWSPEQRLEELPQRATVTIEGRDVRIRAWRYVIHAAAGGMVPVYLLDTALPENDARDREITDRLYGGDERYRLQQEAVLGIGGVAMLRALEYPRVAAYHLNEGHSALLAIELVRERLAGRPLPEAKPDDLSAVRRQCVFTTHTPVPAGHDQFPLELVSEVLGPDVRGLLHITGCCPPGILNMTHLALHFAHFINGVAMRHEEISQGMFPEYPIHSISNGVHAETWLTSPFQMLFDRRIPYWRRQNLNLRYAGGIPEHEIREAHAEAKGMLLAEVERRAGVHLDQARLTIGFARRAAAYKRPDLLFTDVERLRRIAQTAGPLQVIYAGKAHPADEVGKETIKRVFEAASALGNALPVIYLEDYDLDLARTLCGGVDLWLNTPQRPQEASGTSGMKAALNGVPSLSVLDGWWIEGHVEGVTGWSIGESWEPTLDAADDANALYDKLERVIVPMFYGRPSEYDRVMRSAVALNGSFFNAERMLFQYGENAYGFPTSGHTH